MKAEIKWNFNGRVRKPSQGYLPASGTKTPKYGKQNRKSLVTWAKGINSGDQESQKEKKRKWKTEKSPRKMQGNFPELKDTEPPD